MAAKTTLERQSTNEYILFRQRSCCSAQMMVDKHVIKMILESAQMLCSAKRKLDGIPYYAKTKNGRKIKRYKLTDRDWETGSQSK